MIRRFVIPVVAGTLLLVVGAALFTGFSRSTSRHEPPRFPLGDTVPDVVLRTLAGDSVSLRQRLGSRPALIYVFGPEHCASCSNLSMEFRIVTNVAPHVQPILVASGAPAESFRSQLQQIGIEDKSLVDEHRALLRGIQVHAEPIVLLAGPSGRILFVDTRSVPRAGQYPIGRILHDLKGVLNPSPASDTRDLPPGHERDEK